MIIGITYLLPHCDSLKKRCKQVDNSFEKIKGFSMGGKEGEMERERKKIIIMIAVIHGGKAKIHNEMINLLAPTTTKMT